MNGKFNVEIRPLVGKNVHTKDAKVMGLTLRNDGTAFKTFDNEQSAVAWAEKAQQKFVTKNYECKVGENNIFYFIRRIIVVMMFCLFTFNSYTSFASTPEQVKTESVVTTYKYKDSKGIEYPVYRGSKGGYYIIRISKNTGKEYKQYLTAEQKEKLNIK
jgi:hypothetical protein